MGEEVGVSESTVVRFATALGYEGYPVSKGCWLRWLRTKLIHSTNGSDVGPDQSRRDSNIGSTVGYREDKADNGRN